MVSAFNVPIPVLVDQARKITGLYKGDSEENRQALAGIGLGRDRFDEIAVLAGELDECDMERETLKTDAGIAKEEADEALRAILDWRKRDVLPRAKIALEGDGRFRRFHPEKPKSLRAASVIRLGKLLVDALRKYEDFPEMVARGMSPTVAQAGDRLIERADLLDRAAVAVHMDQIDATAVVNRLGQRLSAALSEIGNCAEAVFEPGSSDFARYGLSEIRNHQARSKKTRK